MVRARAFIQSHRFTLVVRRCRKIKAAPGYKPCHRTTLSTSHLAARNAEANAFKIKRLQHGKQYGFLVTSDGWRNKKRRSYHNFILVAANGPIFLSLKDVTGQAGTAELERRHRTKLLNIQDLADIRARQLTCVAM